MLRNEIYSEELNRLLDFMENVLAKELPTTVLTTDYFMLAILNQRANIVYKRLSESLTENSITMMHNTYYQMLASNSLNAVKPGRDIKYSTTLVKYIMEAEEEMKKLSCEKITSDHVMLAILKDDTPENKIKKLINKVGITYESFYEKAYNDLHTNEKITEEFTSNGMTVYKIEGNINSDPTELVRNFIERRNAQNKKNTNNNQQNTAISKYCVNLNNLYLDGKIDRIIGREREMSEILRILGKRRKNNVIVLGSEGVGKTALAENVACMICEGNVPIYLKGKELVYLDMTALMAGTTLRGMFEERVKNVLDEIKTSSKYILLIDNIADVLCDNGKNEYDLASMLTHALDNADIQIIGTSDFKGFRKTFDSNPSLSRKFQQLIIEAPSMSDSYDILNGIKSYYESYHDVKYSDEAIKSCVDLSSKYITERNLPDSAIDVMDEAGSYISANRYNTEEIKICENELKFLEEKSEKLKNNGAYTEYDAIQIQIKDIKKKMTNIISDIKKKAVAEPSLIDESNIAFVISNKTGIPIQNMNINEKMKLSTMNERIKKEIIGQDDAIDTICKALKRGRIGLRKNGCLYSGFMIGPSGVGKTLIAKKLAKEMFGDESKIIRFDMSEYPDKSAVNKLIGSNPGYIGYEEGGQLTESVKRKKHCVLLLDEIEKADKEVYNIFLQVLDEGFLTDNSGMKVDFKNVIILFTSNIGAKNASSLAKGIGFNENEDENKKRILSKELKNEFPPEFINRIDNVIYFNSLTDDNLTEIIKLELNKMIDNIKSINYNASYDDNVVNFILNKIKFDKEYGARPIMRFIQDNIEDKITDKLIENDYYNGYNFIIKNENDEILVE